MAQLSGSKGTKTPHEKGALETHQLSALTEIKDGDPILEWEPSLKFSGAPKFSGVSQTQPSSRSYIPKRLERTTSTLWWVTWRGTAWPSEVSKVT